MKRNGSKVWFVSLDYKLAIAICLACALGCYGTNNRGGSGETHFLLDCSQGVTCAEGLQCICGVCTVRCDENDSCKEQSELASCMPSDCSEERTCDVECEQDADCDDLGSKYKCQNGRCRGAATDSTDTESGDSGTRDRDKDAAIGDGGSNDGEVRDGSANDGQSNWEACLGTDRADEITAFTVSQCCGMPVPCDYGGYITPRESYEVDFIEGTIAYDVLNVCEPPKSSKVVLTDEQISQLRSVLVQLELQSADGSYMPDYGEGTLSIPGCGDFPSEGSLSLNLDFTSMILPDEDFGALLLMARQIALANHPVTETISCPPGCDVIAASPVIGCVRQQKESPDEQWTVACECSGEYPATTPQCRLRRWDHSAWFFAAEQLANPDEWGECSEKQKSASSVSCDFQDCVIPPPTTCGAIDWCDEVDCGGLRYDERGCARPSCDSDSDCKDDERCIRNNCAVSTECSAFSADHCECLSLESCGYGNACNPVATVGPRGEWLRLEMNQRMAVDCPPDQTCGRIWTFTPDGDFTHNENGAITYLSMSQDSLEQLEQMINGPELRVALRDGIECGPALDGSSVSILLELEGQKLERDVSDCILGPDGNVFQRLYNLYDVLLLPH